MSFGKTIRRAKRQRLSGGSRTRKRSIKPEKIKIHTTEDGRYYALGKRKDGAKIRIYGTTKYLKGRENRKRMKDISKHYNVKWY